MGSAVKMRTDYSTEALRQLAKASKDSKRSRRLLSLAAVREGMSRQDAARIGGMDRQTLRQHEDTQTVYGRVQGQGCA